MWPLLPQNIYLSTVYRPGSYALLESIFYIGCWVQGKVTLGYNICLSSPDQGQITFIFLLLSSRKGTQYLVHVNVYIYVCYQYQ